MKKVIIGMLCAVFLVIGVASPQAFAANISEDFAVDGEHPLLRSLYIKQTVTTLTITAGQAVCEGTVTGYRGVTTKVVIDLYLERKTTNSSTWTTYTSSSKTINAYTGGHQLTSTVPKGYEYRVRAVYKAYAGTKFETVTGYSKVVKY